MQLKYFLQTGLAQDQDFNIQQQGLYPQAYVLSISRIQAYITDGGEKWAEQLHTMYVNNLAIDVPYVASTHDMSRVNQGATLLTVLQPSGDLAKDYYQNFITATLQSKVDAASYQDKDSLMQWLPQWLQELLNRASIDPSKIPDSSQLAIEQLKELLAQSGNNMSTVADEMATILPMLRVVQFGRLVRMQRQHGRRSILKYPRSGRCSFLLRSAMGLAWLFLHLQTGRVCLTTKEESWSTANCITWLLYRTLL